MDDGSPAKHHDSSILPTSCKGNTPPPTPGDMNASTETEEFPVLANLTISPNLQALLEFDDRLRTPTEIHGRSGTGPAGLTQGSRRSSWTQQEVPTASLPPPRRKKNAVADVPVSPKTISDLPRVPSPTDSLPEICEFGGLGEIIFARSEDELEDETGLGSKGIVNPYLNSPPSSPRYFYPLSDDEVEEVDRPRSRSTRRHVRQRSFSGDQPPGERKGGKFVPPRYFTSFCRKVGSKPKQKGKPFSFASLSFFLSYRPLAVPPCKISVTRAAATRPLLLHSHKASFSSSHSHQVRLSVRPFSCTNSHLTISSSDRVLLRTLVFSRTTHLRLKVCTPLVGVRPVRSESSFGYRFYPFLAPSTLLLPSVPYRSHLRSARTQSKAPSSTSLHLQCHLRLMPGLTSPESRNRPPATTPLVLLTPAHAPRAPRRSPLYRLPPNRCSTALARFANRLTASPRLKTLRQPHCPSLTVPTWSRGPGNSRNCLVKLPAPSLLCSVRYPPIRCNNHTWLPTYEEGIGSSLQFQILCTLATEASGHLPRKRCI